MDINAAINYGLLVEAAEDTTTMPLDQPGLDLTNQAINGYTVLATLYANDLATDINPSRDYLPFGFIARAPAPATEVVVAIRGTATVSEWMADATFLTKPYPYVAAGNTEDGFTDLYASLIIGPATTGLRAVDALRNILQDIPNSTLTICGHSLGSAIATLLALDVAGNITGIIPTVYTFASPYVGDPAFANAYNNRLLNSTWRIANQIDIVTHMPPGDYAPVGQPYLLNSMGKVVFSAGCCHHMTTYLNLLGVAVGRADLLPEDDCKLPVPGVITPSERATFVHR